MSPFDTDHSAVYSWLRSAELGGGPGGPERRELKVDQQLLDLRHGPAGNASGVPVTPRNAYCLPAVFAAIQVVASDVAVLPLRLHRRMPDRARVEARDHPIWDALSVSPDGETTSIRQRQAQMAHVLSWGNGYSEIGFTRGGRAARLYLIPDPTSVYADRTPYTKKLHYRVDGVSHPPRKILHLAGLSSDGLTGLSPVTYCRQAIGLGLALETASAAYFGKGARPGGFVEWDKKFETADEAEEFRRDFRAIYGGPENTGAWVLLEPGMKAAPFPMNYRDAQFLEGRQFQTVDVARIFRVPPHKIGDYSQMQLASSGVEQANLMYVVETLLHWCEQWEQMCNLRLLTPEERRQGYYFEHLLTALLRGDMKARGEFYRLAIANGWMSRDEVRERENLDPIGADAGGDIYTIQSNMTTLAYVMAGTNLRQQSPSPPGAAGDTEADPDES